MVPPPSKRISQPQTTFKPLWKGPYVGGDGITNSLLCSYLVCKHRFWLRTFKGLDEYEPFNVSIEYGCLWHEAEEALCRGDDWKEKACGYANKLLGKYPEADNEIRKWYQVFKRQFPVYVNWWKHHNTEVGRTPILEEKDFKVPIELPSGRTILLRGKFDAIYRIQNVIYLQENKTKGSIDEDGLQSTLQFNIQAMIYQLAMRTCFYNNTFHVRPDLVIKLPTPARNYTIAGTLYNVIRRPLADNRAIKQRKEETDEEFLDRVQQEIETTVKGREDRTGPEYYFMRWKIQMSNADVIEFTDRMLFPILENLCDWYDSVSKTPENPFESPLHWQTPWGIYNSMFGGFRGEFYEYLSKGRTSSLVEIPTLFPELETK